MIIFYNKKTGRIVGAIYGRIHPKSHLKMWVGDKNENKRIIVNWQKVKDKKYFEAVHEQKELFTKLDKNPRDIYKYKVDLKTERLIPCL